MSADIGPDPMGLEPDVIARLTHEAARTTSVDDAFRLAIRVVHYSRTADTNPNTAYTGAAVARRLLERVTGQTLAPGSRESRT